jgi:hypothetical protein
MEMSHQGTVAPQIEAGQRIKREVRDRHDSGLGREHRRAFAPDRQQPSGKGSLYRSERPNPAAALARHLARAGDQPGDLDP